MRSDTKNVRNGLRRRDAGTADLDAVAAMGDYADLLAIPRLGLVRAESLAAAGIKTLADLRGASESDLARVKWVGAGNARLIKQWLAEQPNGAAAPAGSESLGIAASATADSPSDSAPAESGKGRRKRTSERKSASSKAVKASAPAAPARKQAPAAPYDAPPVDREAAIDDLPNVVVSEALQEDIGQIDTAISRLKEAIPKKSRDKKLGRQLNKVASSVSDVPENFEVLQNKEKIAATKALDRIAKLLSDAVESGKLSAKKQETMGVELKKFRKRLVKALGGQ